MLTSWILAQSNDTLPLAIATIVAAGLASGPAIYAAIQSRSVKREVKTPDNTTVGQLLVENRRMMRKLIRFERYTHKRNHQILGAIFKVYLALFIIAHKLDVELPEQAEPDYTMPDDGDDEDDLDDDPLA